MCYTPLPTFSRFAGAGVCVPKLDSAWAIAYKNSYSSTSLGESITW